MRFNKKLLLFCLSWVLLFSLTIAGCAAQEPTTQEIIDKSIQAAADMKSYKFDMDMEFDIDVTSEDEPVAMNIAATGTGAADVTGHQMEMIMEMKMDIPELGKQNIKASYYWTDGWMYMGMTLPMVGEQWMKTRLDIDNMASQDQLAQQMELLKSAGQATRIGDEVVNGIDCHVLELDPDMAAILDWFESQPTNSLQGFDLGDIDLSKMFDNLKVKEWISKKDFSITRTEISLTMDLTPEDMGIEGQNNERMNMEMRMAMDFRDYGQPVIIILPGEALAAEEIHQ